MNILFILPILYNHHEAFVKEYVIGLSIGSFYMATLQLFRWIMGRWELVSSVFSIILSIYFASSFQIYNLIYRIHKKTV